MKKVTVFVLSALLLTSSLLTMSCEEAKEGVTSPYKAGRIAFSSKRDGNYEIYVMNIDGSNQTRLTKNTVDDYTPAWSPEGTKIAFNSGGQIFIMNADGTNQVRLTDGYDGQPAWSPDGSKIAFSSRRDGNDDDIYVMNADGSNQTRLTSRKEAKAVLVPSGDQLGCARFQSCMVT